MTTQIKSTIPVLASLDIAESADFYTARLGFKKLSQYDDYAIVARDGAEIHFWLCRDRSIAENTSCYLRVTDTEALFKEFAENGVQSDPPAVRPWGMKELYVIDPHGNLLKFGEPA
ncbi:bleomycin resistance protein [Noviherbaspirillum sp. ST9]|uniref:bleomycin resistance protein n=1 Tax=Noviherbaspirillum sp. ST9 TaxID=3401606 RepID=UPI003B5883C2